MVDMTKQVNKVFESELTTSLVEHYLQTGKKFFWTSVAREDGILSHDFAIQLRRAEMHGEIYVKKIAGDWKICLTKKVTKQVGERDKATIFREVCKEMGKENEKPTRLSKTSIKILLRLNQNPKTSIDLATGLKVPNNNMRPRLAKLKKCGYVEKESIFWRLTSLGAAVVEQLA